MGRIHKTAIIIVMFLNMAIGCSSQPVPVAEVRSKPKNAEETVIATLLTKDGQIQIIRWGPHDYSGNMKIIRVVFAAADKNTIQSDLLYGVKDNKMVAAYHNIYGDGWTKHKGMIRPSMELMARSASPPTFPIPPPGK